MTEFDPIATREFRKGETTVTLSIGRPDRNPDGVDYGCVFRIDGLTPEPEDIRIVGIDELQALMEALKVARASLENQGLTFLDQPGIRMDLG